MDFLKKIWRLWRKFADFVLELVFQIILFVFYFTVLVPFALIFKSSDKLSFAHGWKSSNESKAEDMY